MKKFTKMIMLCGLFMGGMMLATSSFAQNEAQAPGETKSDVVKEVSAETGVPSTKKACQYSKKSCASKKAAMGGGTVETTANAGAKKSCTAKKTSCTGGAKVSTVAAGSNAKKSCTAKKKACTGGAKVSTAAAGSNAKAACKPGCAAACCVAKADDKADATEGGL